MSRLTKEELKKLEGICLIAILNDFGDFDLYSKIQEMIRDFDVVTDK